VFFRLRLTVSMVRGERISRGIELHMTEAVERKKREPELVLDNITLFLFWLIPLPLYTNPEARLSDHLGCSACALYSYSQNRNVLKSAIVGQSPRGSTDVFHSLSTYDPDWSTRYRVRIVIVL